MKIIFVCFKILQSLKIEKEKKSNKVKGLKIGYFGVYVRRKLCWMIFFNSILIVGLICNILTCEILYVIKIICVQYDCS